jgi:hypothetical protein
MKRNRYVLPSQLILLKYFSYDPDTGIVRNLIKRKGANIGDVVGSDSGKGYLYASFHGVKYRLHRLIWKMVTGRDPIAQIDHEDLDGINNRWVNLREATQAQNQTNKPGWCKSGLKGAYLHHTGRWVSRITVDKKGIHLGIFDTMQEAHRAYVAAALKIRGEFARGGK